MAVALPGPPLTKRLAYDVVRAAVLSEGDWPAVATGVRMDIAGTFSVPEVVAAALRTLPALPPHRFAEMLSADGAFRASLWWADGT